MRARRCIHQSKPDAATTSQRNVGLPQSWPSGASESGGAPASNAGLKISGCAHTSAESAATYMGMSPMIMMP